MKLSSLLSQEEPHGELNITGASKESPYKQLHVHRRSLFLGGIDVITTRSIFSDFKAPNQSLSEIYL